MSVQEKGLCSGQGVSVQEGVSVQGSLSSRIGSLSGGFLPWASLQGRGLCPEEGVPVQWRGFLQGRGCLSREEGLCPEEGVSIQGSLSGGGGLFTGVFVQRGLSRGSLFRKVDL